MLAILQPWAEAAEPIHRRLAHLADVDSEPARDVLWIGCGSGRSVLWWAQRYQSHIEGVDPDPKAIERAERAVREAGLQRLATFQTADPPSNLPHEAHVFDITIVHMLQLDGVDAAAVMAEAARVARPMSTVIALVPSWQRDPTESAARAVRDLGVTPYLLVEWKSFLREAGVVELAVEDAAPDARWIASGWLGLLVRGWRAAGWWGIRFVLSRPLRVLRALALARVLGLSIVKGTRWPHG